MKIRLFSIMLVSFIGFISTSCYETKPTSDRLMEEKSEELMSEAHRQIGMPAMRNFQERKQLKELYELRDQEDLILHAYLFNEREGKVGQYLGLCQGYGIGASTQFSNPEKMIWRHNHGYHNTPQAEPNGLFMPEGLSATWLNLLDSDGNPRPTYIEPPIIVSPIPLHETLK